MAGSKTSNIFSVLSFAALATLMFLSILNVVPRANAEETECLTLLADVPGSGDYCKGFLGPSSSAPSSSFEMGHQWGQDLEQCWSSLISIQGCVGDIFFALLSGDFSKLELDCCKAIERIAVECWLKMFPWNPMFPTKLMGACKNIH